jgi:hypothetical protein
MAGHQVLGFNIRLVLRTEKSLMLQIAAMSTI